MAKNDIEFHLATGHGPVRTGYPLAASATFEQGDVLAIAAAGTVDEAGDDPVTVAGIAAVQSTDSDGTSLATGTMVPINRGSDDELYRCNQFATDGAGTTVVPTQANAIGALAGFTTTGGVWFVDTGTANLHVRIDDVLDSAGNSVTGNNVDVGAGATVVFRFV